jgi:hypothetical protein
MPEAQ